MANYATLKSAIQNVIRQNGNNEITGNLLQQSLLSMIESLGAGFQFMGVATPGSGGTNPGTPDQRVFYIGGPGAYPNIGNANILSGQIGVFCYSTAWNTYIIDICHDEIELLNDIVGVSGTPLVVVGSAKSYIPTQDGSLLSGGTDYRGLDFNIENLNSVIKIVSDAITPDPEHFVNVVLWALYSSETPSQDSFIVGGPLLSTGQKESTIDLSQYPTAKTIRVVTDMTLQGATVTSLASKFASKQEFDELAANAVLKTDIVDNLESNDPTKPLSAKQGKILNGKFSVSQNVEPYDTNPGSIPTQDGSLQSGGGLYRAKDFDLTGLNGNIIVVSDAAMPDPGSFVNCVTWGIYSAYPVSPETVIAVGNLLSVSNRQSTIDLSQYPTAKTIRVSTDATAKAATVTNVSDKYATKQELSALEREISDLQSMETGVSVHLPPEIVLPVGGRLEIFTRGVVKAINPYNYNVVVVCPVGKAYPRYFLFEATQANVGNNYTLQYKVLRNDGSLISEGSTTISVIAAATSPATQKNILCVGASIMAQGYVASELRRRLTAKSGDPDYGNGTPFYPYGKGLENIQFVGRKQGSRVPGINQEATGGWSWEDYSGTGLPAYRFQVTGVNSLNIGDQYTQSGLIFTISEINVTDGSGEIRCIYSGSGTPAASGTLTLSSGTGDATITYTSVSSESYNPFYNNGSLDFVNYANLYCGGKIDYLIAYCGNNDIAGANMQTVMAHLTTFADAFHASFPNSKFIVCNLALPDVTGGMGANYGATELMSYYKYACDVFAFADALNTVVSTRTAWMAIAPTMQEFDNEFSYPYGDVPANNRTQETVKLGQNGIHPTENGQKMFSDTLFYVINKYL